ncbi:hypothetical protein F441_13916 [Phytophthora nicotianae CJ01A1]|uniref:Uncharacterized protein n=1 Tax=Phytophthora nicotianae CJ01A1 TaxID=1317063 RepID=W2WJC0_PHYNI|nr:hypothetical protein F441_13916 [Phytophthora nicotianae CJ01A1]
METEADLSGNESDATVVLEYTDGDDEANNSSLQVEPTQLDVESEVLETKIVVEHAIVAPLDVSSGDSEDLLDFGSDSEDYGIEMAAQNRREPVPPKEIFKSMGFTKHWVRRKMLFTALIALSARIEQDISSLLCLESVSMSIT